MADEITGELNKQPDDQQLHEAATAAIGRINLLVAGGTGVGKSTLINAVFGEGVAPTSTGRPETMEITRYSIPGKPLELFDTRGFEAGSTAAIDTVGAKLDELTASNNAGAHIHLAWLCINTHSSRIEPAHRDFLADLAARGIPCIVVLTKSFGASMLEAAKEHAQPSGAVVEVLAMPMGEPARGVDHLIAETYRLAPEGVRTAFVAAQQADLSLKKIEALRMVHRYAAMAVGTGPLPLVDIPAVWLLQRKMRAHIDQIFGIDHNHPATAALRNEKAAGLLSLLGSAVRNLVLKILPETLAKISGVGTLAAMAAAGLSSGAATETLGRAYVHAIMVYFETGKSIISEAALNAVVKMIESVMAGSKARVATVAA